MTDEASPVKDDSLSAEQMQTLKEWLESKTKNLACPVCNNRTWSVGSHVLYAGVMDQKTITPGQGAYPQVFAACTNCYHVRTFLAAPIGLFGPEEGAADD